MAAEQCEQLLVIDGMIGMALALHDLIGNENWAGRHGEQTLTNTNKSQERTLHNSSPVSKMHTVDNKTHTVASCF